MDCEQHLRCYHSRLLFLLLGIASVSFVHCAITNTYWREDIDALQAIFAAWSATPDQRSNLNGWSASQIYPCTSLMLADSTTPNWREVYQMHRLWALCHRRSET